MFATIVLAELLEEENDVILEDKVLIKRIIEVGFVNETLTESSVQKH